MSPVNIRLAYLAHIPECDFERYGFQFDRKGAESNIRGEAFSTVEGAFLRGFVETGELDIHAISFNKFVSVAQKITVSDGLTIHLLPTPKFTGMSVGWLPRALRVRKLLREIQPDVVHGMRNLEGYGLMALLSGYPHVVTIEEFMEGIPFPPHMRWSFLMARWVEKWVNRNASHLVAISHHVKNRLLEMGARGDIQVIPNVAKEAYYTVVKRQRNYFLYVGRISHEKGLLDVIQAMATPECKKLNPKLVVIGGGSGPEGAEYLEHCKKTASTLFPEGDIQFKGALKPDEIVKYHEESIALIMPSQAKYEGMGVVIVEALAAGTPVITYDFGPMPEFVAKGKTGLIVSAGNIKDLGDAMSWCISEGSFTQKSEPKCREAALQYTITAITQKYLNIFLKMSV